MSVTGDINESLPNSVETRWRLSIPCTSCLKLRYSLFWNFTHSKLVVSYGRFGTTHRSHFQDSRRPVRFFLECLRLEDGTDGLSQSTLRISPEERRSHSHRGGSLKSRTWLTFLKFLVTVWLYLICCYSGDGGNNFISSISNITNGGSSSSSSSSNSSSNTPTAAAVTQGRITLNSE